MNSHSQKEHMKKKEVKGLKRVFNRLFSGSKLDEKLIENVLSCNYNEVEELIKKGADVNTRDGMGNTCLMLACDLEDFNLVNLFLSKNADLDVSNKFKQTALHIAAGKRSLNILRLLVNSDNLDIVKKINKQNEEGNTPLHIAVDNSNKDMVDFLLKRKANKHVRNKNGLRPVDIARTKGLEAIRILLYKNN
jgi:uncharacterized protein